MEKYKSKSKPKQGMSLHKYIATGGDIKKFDGANHNWGTTKDNSKKK